MLDKTGMSSWRSRLRPQIPAMYYCCHCGRGETVWCGWAMQCLPCKHYLRSGKMCFFAVYIENICMELATAFHFRFNLLYVIQIVIQMVNRLQAENSLVGPCISDLLQGSPLSSIRIFPAQNHRPRSFGTNQTEEPQYQYASCEAASNSMLVL